MALMLALSAFGSIVPLAPRIVFAFVGTLVRLAAIGFATSIDSVTLQQRYR
jgi:hypothetical protein